MQNINNLIQWAEDHNEVNYDDDYSGNKPHVVTLWINDNVDYEFTGTLYEYRNLPCKFEIEKIEIIHLDDNGDIVDRIEVETVPQKYIDEAIRIAEEEL